MSNPTTWDPQGGAPQPERTPPGTPGAVPHGWPQPAAGYPTYGYAPAPAPQRSSRLGVGIAIGAAIGLLLGLVVGGIAGVALGAFAGGGSGTVSALGEDARVDAVYELCREGDMAACDLLFYDSTPGSELEEFGATCGGRTEYLYDEYCTEVRPSGEAGSVAGPTIQS